MQRFCRALLPFFVLGLLLVGCDSGGTNVPSDVGDSTAVSFTTPDDAVGEGDGSYTVEIEATDPGHEEFGVDVSVNQSQSSATLGEDVSGLSGDTTVTFPETATTGSTQSLSFDVVDDDEFLEGDETLVLSLSTADTSETAVGEVETFTLTIEENDEAHTTQEARDLETGSRTVVEGIATRVGPDGVYLQDDEGALYVFDGDLAGQVSQGDEVRVDGTTGYFSGLFQIEGASSGNLTEVLSSGNELPEPQTVTLGEVTENGEEYESELVRVEDFAIDAGGDATFQADGAYTIDHTAGSSTLFVPEGSELVGEDISARANFQGVLGQFNNFGEPDDNSGYQLLGLTVDDVEPLETVTVASADFSDNNLDPMTAYNVASNENWEVSSAGDPPNAPYAAINGFGADEPSNDWLITPALNFNNHSEETLTFLNAKNHEDSQRRGLQVKVSTDYGGSGNPEDATWTDISDRVENYSGGSYEFVSSGEIDLSDEQFQSDTVYIAFQYQSTSSSDAAAWQVDEIVVRGVESN